jgi:hypothetical protein
MNSVEDNEFGRARGETGRSLPRPRAVFFTERVRIRTLSMRSLTPG